MCEFYGVETLDGFGAFSRAEIAAAALALAYVKRTQLDAPAGALAADPAGARREPRDRSGHPGQPRAHTHARRRARGLAARDDRPDRDAGRRAAPGRAPREPADRPGRDRARGSIRSASSSSAAPMRDALRSELKGAPDFLRSLSRLSLDRGGPRDLAAVRDGLAAARRARAHPGERPTRCRPSFLRASRRCGADCGALRADLARALADDLPLVKRDGGFVRAGACRARRGARSARREPARDRRDAGALRGGDRRPAAQDQAQQLPRLLHRDAAGAGRGAAEAAAERDLHPSPDDGGGAALHHQRAHRARSQDRLGRRPRARARARRLRAASPGVPRRGRRLARASAPRSPRSTSRRRWRSWRRSATGRARSSTPRSPSVSRAAAIRWSRRR